MKKYIIAAAAALAIGMALSACAKEGEAIVPIIIEGGAEQQTASTPEVTPEAAPDAAAQVSKTQMVEGTGYTATLTEDTDGDGGLIYRLKASAGENEEELMEYTAGAGDGISAEVYEIDDLFGFPAFCFELSYPMGSERTYYIYANGGILKAGEGFGFESAADGDYRDDLDGDGIEELICNCTYMADGVERVYVFRFRDGRVEEGELDKYEDIVSEEELDGAGQISQRYDPDLRAIVFTYYAEDGDKTLELKDYERFTFSAYEV